MLLFHGSFLVEDLLGILCLLLELQVILLYLLVFETLFLFLLAYDSSETLISYLLRRSLIISYYAIFPSL